MNELALAVVLCNLLNGGETEMRHTFPNLGDSRAVRIDCETPSHVMEIGLDGKDDSRDSIHQAVFASILTGKAPIVIMIDQDGVEGRYEYEMRMVTSRLRVPYVRCSKDFVLAWAAAAPWRDIGLDKSLDDLPRKAGPRQSTCDLAKAIAASAVN